MAKLVPHDVDYKKVNFVENINDKILYSSAILSIAIIVIDNGDYFKKENQEGLLNLFNGILGILAISYFAIDIIRNYLFQLAEEHRRSDFVDNSLGTTVGQKNSEGYFSNDTLKEGTFKMGVNCFENSFFTYKVTNRMIRKVLVKSIVVILLILAIAF